MERSNYPTTHRVREACEEIVLCVLIGIILAMVIAPEWFR